MGALDQEGMFCECCQMPTDKAADTYGICSSVMKLESLGSGFPMFYKLKIFFIFMYLVMTLVAGGFCLYSNYTADNGDEWIDGNTPTYVVRMSLGNHGSSSSAYTSFWVYMQVILHLVVMGIVLLSTIIFRRRQLKMEADIDEKNLTPSDFGIFVNNLPNDKTEDEVKEWFCKLFKNKIDIVYVNYAYEIGDIIEAV